MTRQNCILIVGILLLLVSAGSAAAESDTWDKSSITLDGRCLPDGTAEFVVTNTGRAMAGPSAWREYEADVLTQNGTFQLTAGGSQTWTFASNGVSIRFEADQRPGHPGSSAPRLTLTCDRPTALKLTSFSASSAGNRGGCGMQGIDWCTVSASGGSRRSGYWVDLTCEDYAVPRIKTRALWQRGAKIELWGCISLDADGHATRLTGPFTLARR